MMIKCIDNDEKRIKLEISKMNENIDIFNVGGYGVI